MIPHTKGADQELCLAHSTHSSGAVPGWALVTPTGGYNSSCGPGCVELMLQCRLRANVVPGHLVQTSPNQSVTWAQSHLPPPPPNNYTKQISNSNEDPAENMFKDRLPCCFPDNTRMISCTKLLVCPHPAGKNPISKQLMLHHY